MLVPKEWKNVAQVLHNNRVKFPKDFFAIVLSINMAAVTSGEIKKYSDWSGAVRGDDSAQDSE